MKLVLLEVGRSSYQKAGFNEFHFNLALGYLAAAAEKYGHKVLMIQQLDQSESDLVEKVLAFSPDVVGFTCNTHNYPASVSFKKKLEVRLDCLYIIGGVHASCAPEEAALDFDVVVCGEGEETVAELLNYMEAGITSNARYALRGIAFRDEKGRFVENPRRVRIRDLDKFGPPKRPDPFFCQDKQIYPAVPGHPPFAPISFSRGCRRCCSFCTNARMYQSQCVSRQPAKIVEEMLTLRDRYGVSDFYVHDEDVFSDVGLVKEVCRLLIGAKAGLTWMGMASIEPVTPELVAIMHEAGCVMLAFGLESGADVLRNEFGKPFSPVPAQERICATFDAGIIPVGLFVLGTPRETDETLDATLAFAASLKCLRYRFAYIYPYPGTLLRKEIDGQKLWLEEKYKSHQYAADDLPVVRCGIDPGRLARKQHEFLSILYGSKGYAANVREFVLKNPAWRYSISVEWKNVVERELGQSFDWTRES